MTTQAPTGRVLQLMDEGGACSACLAGHTGAFSAASPKRSLLLDSSAPEECPHLEVTGLVLTCRPDHPQGLLFNPAVPVGHPEGAQAWIMVTLNLFTSVPWGGWGVGGLGPVSRSQISPTVHFSGPSKSSHVCFLQEEHQSPT